MCNIFDYVRRHGKTAGTGQSAIVRNIKKPKWPISFPFFSLLIFVNFDMFTIFPCYDKME